MTNKQKPIDFDEYFEECKKDGTDTRTSLQIAVEWIKKNLSPDQVFSRTELRHFYDDHKDELENKYPTIENY